MDGISQTFRRWTFVGALMLSLALVAVSLPGCQASTIPFVASASAKTMPTQPAGWTWYRDGARPIAVPVPPKWQAHGYWNEIYVGDRCQRKVDLVPPVTQRGYVEGSPDRNGPELISIVVSVTCREFDPARDNHNLTPAGTTFVGGAHATFYMQLMQLDDAGDQRVVIAHFGGEQYVCSYAYEFGDATPQAGDQVQVAIFNTVLKDFIYLGK